MKLTTAPEGALENVRSQLNGFSQTDDCALLNHQRYKECHDDRSRQCHQDQNQLVSRHFSTPQPPPHSTNKKAPALRPGLGIAVRVARLVSRFSGRRNQRQTVPLHDRRLLIIPSFHRGPTHGRLGQLECRDASDPPAIPESESPRRSSAAARPSSPRRAFHRSFASMDSPRRPAKYRER